MLSQLGSAARALGRRGALSVRLYTTHNAKETFLDTLEKRNMVQATTSSALRSHMASTKDGAFVPRTVYAGVDPSAASIHVGNLLPLLALLHCALYGHTALVLVRHFAHKDWRRNGVYW